MNFYLLELNDTRLDFIVEFGKMALNMADSQGNRKKQLSQNIATATHHNQIHFLH